MPEKKRNTQNIPSIIKNYRKKYGHGSKIINISDPDGTVLWVSPKLKNEHISFQEHVQFLKRAYLDRIDQDGIIPIDHGELLSIIGSGGDVD